MKSFTSIVASLAAVSGVLATPSPVQNVRSPAQQLEARASSTLTPITTKGNAFFAGSDRFYIRGVDYQPGGSSLLVDPIGDITTCTRDIAQFQKLGINAIRVYSVDNTASHDACMSALAAAGIYLILDVNTPLYSLNRANPSPSYNSEYLQNIFATIDAFAGYSNTLAFFSGNEVINDDTTTAAAMYVKAVTRDMKQYIGSRGYRSIPVGYSAADVSNSRQQMAEYMNCGTNDERSDFFAFNDYSWCDPSDFKTSGWDQKVKNFTGYGLPIFLSEYGCITNKRTFSETAALYNAEMTSVYSGGLVYEYSEEGSIANSAYTPNADFTALQSAFASNAIPTGDGGYSATSTASTCPPSSALWNVTSDALPAIPSAAAGYMKSGAGAGPGFKGKGSQNGSGTSAGTATPGSGQVTSVATGAASTSKSAASHITATPFDRTPMIVGMIVLALSAMGATLL